MNEKGLAILIYIDHGQSPFKFRFPHDGSENASYPPGGKYEITSYSTMF